MTCANLLPAFVIHFQLTLFESSFNMSFLYHRCYVLLNLHAVPVLPLLICYSSLTFPTTSCFQQVNIAVNDVVLRVHPIFVTVFWRLHFAAMYKERSHMSYKQKVIHLGDRDQNQLTCSTYICLWMRIILIA